jgi:hypothetical protein
MIKDYIYNNFNVLGKRIERKHFLSYVYKNNKSASRMEYLYGTLKLLYKGKIISEKTYRKRNNIISEYEIKPVLLHKSSSQNIKGIVKGILNRDLMSQQAFNNLLKKNPELLEFI